MNNHVPSSEWGHHKPVGWRATWLRMLHRLPSGSVWRRIALLLRKPLKKGLGQWADVEVWGLKLRLRTRGNLSEQRLLLMPQFLDTIERDFLAQELKDGDVFLDIGANAGVYSLWVASGCNGKVRIEAFEPDRELCERLRFNLQTNKLVQVTLHEYALGEVAGEATLVPGNSNRGENRVESSETSGIRVRIEILSDVLQRLGISRVKALKIDVEGQEADVLRPLFDNAAPELLPNVIICELIPNVQRSPLHELLSRFGYRLEARGRLNGIFRRTRS